MKSCLILLFILLFASGVFAQEFHFRKHPSVVVHFQYSGLPQVSEFPFSPWRSEVDLLFLPTVQEILKLSRQQITKIKAAVSEYRSKQYQNVRAPDREKPDRNWELFFEQREQVLAMLEEKQRRRLVALDRYLYFRKYGPANFIKTYFSAVKDDELKRMTRLEHAIWADGFLAAEKEWHKTLESVKERFPDIVAENLVSLDEYFRTPLMADITLVDIELSEPEPEPSTDDERYKRLVGTKVQYELGLDGNWVRRIYFGNAGFVDMFSFYLAIAQQEQQRTGTNELEITEDQFAILYQLEHEYNEELNNLVANRIELEAAEEAAGGSGKSFEERRNELGLAWHQNVWDDVLLPFQKDYLLADAQRRRVRTRGPLGLLKCREVEELANCEAIAKAVRTDFREFQVVAERIEMAVHEKLFRLAQESVNEDLGFELRDRPAYLVPSIAIMSMHGSSTTEK